MPSTVLVDVAGRRRSPATLPAFLAGRPAHNKGLRYPADPPTVQEIVAVMHAAGDETEGVRLRGLIVVLWRAGPRVSEALALAESDLAASRGAIIVRRGKGGKESWPAGVGGTAVSVAETRTGGLCRDAQAVRREINPTRHFHAVGWRATQFLAGQPAPAARRSIDLEVARGFRRHRAASARASAATTL
jgi:integrase